MRRDGGSDGVLLGGILVMLLAFLDSSCAWIGRIVIALFGIKSMMDYSALSKTCLLGIALAVIGSALGLWLSYC